MNDLMSVMKVSSFSEILAAYRKAGINLGSFVDGGAGAGNTAGRMLRAQPEAAKVYAFEPFPGNHRFFADLDPRIELIPKALAAEFKLANFEVPYTVPEGSDWNVADMKGYSSVGSLKDQPREGASLMQVECVRADDAVPEDSEIGFVKLDLQGGEYDALRGMDRILRDVKFMWIEYLGDQKIVEHLVDKGFSLFDTKFVFQDSPSEEALEHFVKVDQRFNSTGKLRWHGFKKKPWLNFIEEFKWYKKNMGMVQTDIVAVNRRHLPEFISVCPNINSKYSGD